MEFVTRGLVDSDRSFIYNSYLKGYRQNYPMSWVPHALYFVPQAEILGFLLKTATTVVACFPEAPEEILGYAIYGYRPDTLVLHYIYSRRSRQGIGRGLLNGIAGNMKLLVATHMCDSYRALRHKAAPMRVAYDPYFIPRQMAMT